MSATSLEITAQETPGPRAAFAPVNRPFPRRILVVEDDRLIGQLYSQALTRVGYQVDTAEDGAAGWAKLHAVSFDPDSYDLLVTDNSMPKLSGVELIRKMRAARMAVPIILASSAVPANIEWLELAAVLPKPFSLELLVQTVKEVLHAEPPARI